MLLIRDGKAAPWRPEFGDYDRDTVAYERQTYRDSGNKASNLKIAASNSARQSCIDYVVAQLNRPITEESKSMKRVDLIATASAVLTAVIVYCLMPPMIWWIYPAVAALMWGPSYRAALEMVAREKIINSI